MRWVRLLALPVVVVLLLAVLAAEGWYLWLRDEPRASAERAVTTSVVTEAAAVDAAAEAVAQILTTTWEEYDEQAEQAEGLMTKSFARDYAQTSDQIRDAFIESKTVVEMTVEWAGVYRADDDKVEVLVFMNQMVTRSGGTPRVVPFRALVTVVPSGSGWLVSDLQTR